MNQLEGTCRIFGDTSTPCLVFWCYDWWNRRKNNWSDTFFKKEYIIQTCWKRSEFKPWRLRKEKQLRLKSGSHCKDNRFMFNFFSKGFFFQRKRKTFRLPRITHEANFVFVTLQIFTPWIILIPHTIVPFLTLN